MRTLPPPLSHSRYAHSFPGLVRLRKIYRVSQKKWDLRRLVQICTFFVQLSGMVFFQYFFWKTCNFLVLQWPKKISKPFFLSKSKIQKNKNVLRKYCFSMILKVSTEQCIFNTLEYAKKKLGQVNLNNFS